MREVREQVPSVVEDLRADRHAQLGILAGGAVLQRPAAAAAALGLEALIRPKPRQVAQIRLGDEHDVAAGPPSPPSGPPFGTCFSRRNERPPSPPRPA